MSGFGNQGGQLRNSLIEAGLPAAAATILSNIFANGVQPLRHSGEVVHDTTPAGMRQITPEDRTQRLTNLDFREGDPDYRRSRFPTSEEAPRKTQQSTVSTTLPPQQTESSFRMKDGAYTSVDPSGDTASVGLRISGNGDCLFRDPASNSLVGRSLRAESDASDRSRLNFFIEPRQNEMVFKVSTSNISTVRVIKDVSFVAGRGIVFTYVTLSAWVVSEGPETVLTVTECPQV